MEFTGERLIPGQTSERILRDHMEQYEFVAQKLPLAGLQVLDVACGVGFGSRLFAEHASATVTGVDISLTAISYGREQFPHPRVKYCVADATQLPFADMSFDAVISLETLEHLDERAAFLNETNRILRYRGLFVVSTPNRTVTSPGKRPLNPYHIREYTLRELSRLLSRYYPRMDWFGQHFVPRALANRAARKFLYLLSRTLVSRGGPDLEGRVYSLGGGFHVRRLSKADRVFFEPRNIMVVCHKV